MVLIFAIIDLTYLAVAVVLSYICLLLVSNDQEVCPHKIVFPTEPYSPNQNMTIYDNASKQSLFPNDSPT
jgi:hypothetical protein